MNRSGHAKAEDAAKAHAAMDGNRGQQVGRTGEFAELAAAQDGGNSSQVERA